MSALVAILIRPPLLTPGSYVSRLQAHRAELAELNTHLVITRDDVAGVDAPGVVVADRWGEIVFAATAPSPSVLPLPDDVVEWVRYVQHQCPECEGESR